MNICSGQCKYIIAIYELGMLKNNKPVRSIDIAQHLGVTRPSVSKMLKRMSCNGFIEEDCSQKVILTAEGLETAKGLYYRYRMLYMFFRRVLHESKENANLRQFYSFLHFHPIHLKNYPKSWKRTLKEVKQEDNRHSVLKILFPMGNNH